MRFFLLSFLIFEEWIWTRSQISFNFSSYFFFLSSFSYYYVEKIMLRECARKFILSKSFWYIAAVEVINSEYNFRVRVYRVAPTRLPIVGAIAKKVKYCFFTDVITMDIEVFTVVKKFFFVSFTRKHFSQNLIGRQIEITCICLC